MLWGKDYVGILIPAVENSVKANFDNFSFGNMDMSVHNHKTPDVVVMFRASICRMEASASMSMFISATNMTGRNMY